MAAEGKVHFKNAAVLSFEKRIVGSARVTEGNQSKTV
jgi:hypothetical protein